MRTRSALRFAARISIVYALTGLFLYRLQFLTPHLPGTDAYYHIKVAWLTRTGGILEAFPWTSFSAWSDRYFDKDFGFHILLVPFTWGDLTAGAKWAAILIGASVLTSFYAVLRLRGLRLAWLWTFLLVAGSAAFAYRMNMTRPHLLSILFTIWGLYFILQGSWRGVLVVGILYALSYTAPQVLVGYAAIHCLAVRWHTGRWSWRVVAAAFAGVALGSVLHPHFPHNFSNWWIQIVGVLSSAWGGSDVDLRLGRELLSSSMRQFLLGHVVVLAVTAAAALSFSRLRDRIDGGLITLLAIASGFFVTTCLSSRFVEYFVPLTLWFAAEVFARFSDAAQHEGGWRARLHPWAFKGLVAAGCVLILGQFALTLRSVAGMIRHQSPLAAIDAARWLSEHSPPMAQVFTCSWDDGPGLLFVNHRNRYLVMLDPNFMYRWKPDVWRTWSSIARGHTADPVSLIRDEFGARYGYCSKRFKALRNQLDVDPRVRIRVDTDRAFLFEIVDADELPPPAYTFQLSELLYRDPAARWPSVPPDVDWTDRLVDSHPSMFIDLQVLVDASHDGSAGSRRMQKQDRCLMLRTRMPDLVRDARFWVRTHGAVTVWVDGELVYRQVTPRPVGEIRHAFVVRHRPDAREVPRDLVIFTCQHSDSWGLALDHELR